MLVGRIPVAVSVSERFEVPSTTQLFGTEALGHPALHLCDVTKLRSLDEDALDAQVSESLSHFRTSRRVRWWSGHTERLSPPNPATSPGAHPASLGPVFGNVTRRVGIVSVAARSDRYQVRYRVRLQAIASRPSAACCLAGLQLFGAMMVVRGWDGFLGQCVRQRLFKSKRLSLCKDCCDPLLFEFGPRSFQYAPL